MGKKESNEIKELKKQKKELKKEINAEKIEDKKKSLIQKHKDLQEKTRDVLAREKTEEIREILQRIINDTTGKMFWNTKRKMSRNSAFESMVIKDANGQRQYEPEAIKEAPADYYEGLYKWKDFPYHPYHKEVEQKMIQYTNDRTHENARYNDQLTIEEIVKIINNKKNGKSAPDFKNEMLKKPGESMPNILVPLIRRTWNDGCTPGIFNMGIITSHFKGKGDKEDLHNYRGITTSSSIGTIFDAFIDNRIESVVPFTQAQGGGRQGMSTFDHVFLLRAVIDIAI